MIRKISVGELGDELDFIQTLLDDINASIDPQETEEYEQNNFMKAMNQR